MTTKFTNMWLSHGRAIRAADPATSADKFPDLVEAATDIIDVVVEAAKKADLSTEQLKWGVECALGGPVKVSDVISLRAWLITSGLMVDEIQPKSAAKKGDSLSFLASAPISTTNLQLRTMQRSKFGTETRAK